MTEVVVEGSEKTDGTESSVDEGQQLISVQADGDDTQLIMVTFNVSEGTAAQTDSQVYLDSVGRQVEPASVMDHLVQTRVGTQPLPQARNQPALEANIQRLKDSTTQTETVFGLEDLPTVQEIVRKTIAKTKRQEMHPPELSHGPVNGIYTCNICARVLRNKVSWQNHLVSHNGAEVFMCGVCGQLFNMRVTLQAHLDMHMREEKKLKKHRSVYELAHMTIGGVYMPGDIVPKDDKPTSGKSEATNANTLQGGTVSKSGQVAKDSTHSLQSFGAGEDDDDALGDIDSEKEMVVEVENGESKAEEPEQPESSFIYACNICGEQYLVKEDCERHLAVHTGGDPGPPPTSRVGDAPKPATPAMPDKPHVPLDRKISPLKAKFSAYIYACNVCGKQYTNKSNCKRHMRIHTDEEKLYECEFCGKRFAQKYEVKMHARIHTGEKPFTCGVCGKTFTERGNWRRHTQIHVRPQEASPYRCGICCKGFFHAEKLQVHLQIHSGQRPFVCTVCGRKVKKIGDMYRHLRTHTGEKPYKCQVCGKGFAQNGNLKDHMKMHTGERPHHCDVCNKQFARKVLLKEHVKHHHKGTTLQDLTEAALEEIERQEAAMEALDTTEDVGGAVVHEIATDGATKILDAAGLGQTIVIDGPSSNATDEAQLLHEEQELELQDVHATLTEKELEAAHVLTVVQDGDNMVYTYNVGTSEVTTIPPTPSQSQTVIKLENAKIMAADPKEHPPGNTLEVHSS